MSGRTDSVAGPAEAEEAERTEPTEDGEAAVEHDDEPESAEFYDEARRARWTATGTGAALALAGVAAALLRLSGPAPALVPAAYATGAAVCAGAAVLGARGRTRRALWLLIAGTMIMALGDQFD
ncbi:hypothetical protein [Streptomyces sp. NBC_00566]|uniref:hypothetical protein n=1 Tax=Streptomyces sp. NBC_00566 TaxID=2975778 RepID=UPI002E8243F6|nr:hypothetical protein [Streptomyces sp. NBC_00566]WUB86639.1 hypothetical protein OG812_08570 [Streptomyces sp. NBC_00566]